MSPTTSDAAAIFHSRLMLHWRHWWQLAVIDCGADLRRHGTRLVAKAADTGIAVNTADCCISNTKRTLLDMHTLQYGLYFKSYTKAQFQVYIVKL